MSCKTHTEEFNLDFMVGKTFDKIYQSNKRETLYFTDLYDSDGKQLQVNVNDDWEYQVDDDWEHHVIKQNFDKISKYEYCDRREQQSIEEGAVIFKNDNITVFFTHDQDCCECVQFESIDIPFEELQGHKILSAKCRTTIRETDDGDNRDTWYIFDVEGVGTATMRWSGSSNGWYSTMVDVYIQDDTIYNAWRATSVWS